ncbi:gfo/Idh/MocA family oxidoreductase [Bacillus sp. HMF5848]|uniref:Gfo/Idh/MocA family protein n=1 Tax=Bacillus sp. HMF5848 TaxID=2495421 RepID=UPI000F7B9541|nr:Gfo/Idh/MocA family oxidoreductase [Bacillus sp. HMF5848]RSK26810.1 gfo/Idh/MocA family oxidoreductase [Bacillus sp. HMF5848]
MSKIRVGIIGTGFGAKVHAPILKEFSEKFDVVAIASVARGDVNKAREDSGVEKVYTDWRTMLANEILDLVIVASAPYLHHDMVVEAFKRGCHVLCEKPMSFNSEQAKAMIQARDEANKLGFITFEYRHLPARRKVRQIMKEGVLGEVLHVKYNAAFPAYQRLITQPSGWLGQKEFAGGMLGAVGSHMIDSLLWWLEDDVVELTANLHTHVKELKVDDDEIEKRTADDSFQLLTTFTKGATSVIDVQFALRHARHQWYLEIYGTEGSLVLENDNKVLLALKDTPLEEVMLETERKIPNHLSDVAKRYYPAYAPFAESLYSAIQNNAYINEYLPTFEDGEKVQNLIDASHVSSDTGKRQYL